MHRVVRRNASPPSGFELIADTLNDFKSRMREAECQPHEGRRKCETLWPIHKLNFERTRYVFDMYKSKSIDKQVVDYCKSHGLIDAPLFAKWKKQGYERLCCIQCIQPSSHNFGTTCLCRVPLKDRENDKPLNCMHCGCSGCSG
ncbi:hypothetical protein P9112_006817 [Eukaryota sp. TZLM1-RC]